MSNTKQKEHGVWISDDIGKNMDLLLSEKIVLSIIVRYHTKTKSKKCTLSNEYFMPYLSTNRRATILETLNSLVKKGYLIIEKNGHNRLLVPVPHGFHNHFKCTNEGEENARYPYKNCTDSVQNCTDSVQNCTDSVQPHNIYNNRSTNLSLELKREQNFGEKEGGDILDDGDRKFVEGTCKFFGVANESGKVLGKGREQDKAYFEERLRELKKNHLAEDKKDETLYTTFLNRTRAYYLLHTKHNSRKKYKTTLRKFIDDIWSQKDWCKEYEDMEQYAETKG